MNIKSSTARPVAARAAALHAVADHAAS